MIRTRFKKVLLVAPEVLSHQLSADYKHVRHIYAINRIFPSIYEINPNLIVFDYNFISDDAEKIIRRIRSNNFYNKIKICCYKTKPNTKTDSLLKTIGVDFFIYQEELEAAPKNKNVAHIFSALLDIPVLGMATQASN
jgi:formyltetrahydrofolate synthetase